MEVFIMSLRTTLQFPQVFRCIALGLLLLVFASLAIADPTFKPNSPTKLERDPNQPVDEEYTKKIKEYTTQPFFNSPLTDYLPASNVVPTPKAVLGDIAGAPGILPYTAEVNGYMRMLEKASPREHRSAGKNNVAEANRLITVDEEQVSCPGIGESNTAEGAKSGGSVSN
jgi:hypothetical protein